MDYKKLSKWVRVFSFPSSSKGRVPLEEKSLVFKLAWGVSQLGVHLESPKRKILKQAQPKAHSHREAYRRDIKNPSVPLFTWKPPLHPQTPPPLIKLKKEEN